MLLLGTKQYRRGIAVANLGGGSKVEARKTHGKSLSALGVRVRSRGRGGEARFRGRADWSTPLKPVYTALLLAHAAEALLHSPLIGPRPAAHHCHFSSRRNPNGIRRL